MFLMNMLYLFLESKCVGYVSGWVTGVGRKERGALLWCGPIATLLKLPFEGHCVKQKPLALVAPKQAHI